MVVDDGDDNILSELAAVFEGLERIIRSIGQVADHELRDEIEAILGRMTRWVWPLLGELDAEGGYDA